MKLTNIIIIIYQFSYGKLMDDIYTAIAMFFTDNYCRSKDRKTKTSEQQISKENTIPEDMAAHIAIVINDEIHAEVAAEKTICSDPDMFANIAQSQHQGKNSMSFTYGDKFVKVQISDQSDPLINEVIVTQILNIVQRDKNRVLFSEYVDHCIYRDCKNRICCTDVKEYETLIIKNMNITSLDSMFDNMPDPFPVVKCASHQKQYEGFLKNLEHYMIQYTEVASSVGMTHNDMHHNNIVIDHNTSKFKVIDYGRSSINLDPKYNKLVCNSCSKFGLKVDVVRKLFDKKSSSPRLAFYQIVDYDLGYMTDIATICITVLPLCGVYFDWPSFFTFDTNTEVFTVDPFQFPSCKEKNKLSVIEKGLLFVAIYLIIANEKVFNASMLLQGGKVHIDTLFKTVFWSNGICKNTVYHKIMDDIKNAWNNPSSINYGSTSRVIGGSPVALAPMNVGLRGKNGRKIWRKNLSESMNSVIKRTIMNELSVIARKSLVPESSCKNTWNEFGLGSRRVGLGLANGGKGKTSRKNKRL